MVKGTSCGKAYTRRVGSQDSVASESHCWVELRLSEGSMVTCCRFVRLGWEEWSVIMFVKRGCSVSKP